MCKCSSSLLGLGEVLGDCSKRGEAGLPQSTTAERKQVLNIPESQIKTHTRLNVGMPSDNATLFFIKEERKREHQKSRKMPE